MNQSRGSQFIVSPAMALSDRRMTAVEYRVLLALCKRANNETGKCWPSQSTIAEDAGISRASVKRAVPRLVELGWVATESRQRADGSADTTVYTINFNNLLVAVPAVIDAAEEADDDNDIDGGGLNLNPPGGGAHVEPTSAQSDPTLVHSSDPRGGVIAVSHELLRGTAAAPAARASIDDETPDEKVRRIRRLLDPAAHGTYDALCATDRIVGATAAIVALVNAPITGGHTYDWQTVSAALVEIASNDFGGRLSAPLLRGMCRRIARGEVTATPSGDLRPAAELLLNFAEKHSLTRLGSRDLWDGRVAVAANDVAGLVAIARAGIKVNQHNLRELLVQVEIYRMAERPRPVAIAQIARVVQMVAA